MRWLVAVFDAGWRAGQAALGAISWVREHDAFYWLIVAIMAWPLTIGIFMALSVILVGVGPIAAGVLAVEDMAFDTVGERALTVLAGAGVALIYTVVALASVVLAEFLDGALHPKYVSGDLTDHIQAVAIAEVVLLILGGYIFYGGG